MGPRVPRTRGTVRGSWLGPAGFFKGLILCFDPVRDSLLFLKQPHEQKDLSRKFGQVFFLWFPFLFPGLFWYVNCQRAVSGPPGREPWDREETQYMNAASSNSDSTRDFSLLALWQVPAIVALALVLALTVNGLRPDGIPLIGQWSGDAAPSAAGDDSAMVSLAEARRLFETGGGLFIDARSPADFGAGHIHGAVNLPWQGVDERFMAVADRIDSADWIITYCDGKTCELSHFLAGFLREMGYSGARVLNNGLSVWRQAGLPVDGP